MLSTWPRSSITLPEGSFFCSASTTLHFFFDRSKIGCLGIEHDVVDSCTLW